MSKIYTAELTAEQICDFADLVRKVICLESPDHKMPDQDVYALMNFLNLMPIPSDEDMDELIARRHAAKAA